MKMQRLPVSILTIAAACLSAGKALGSPNLKDVQFGPDLAREALDPALMCLAIYQNRSVYGWEGPFLDVRGRETFDAGSGLAGGVYRRIKDGQTEIALAFRGTDDEADWRTNFEQLLFDGVPFQYQEAFNLAQLALIDLKKSSPSASSPLVLTGHSLGGGLAAFSGTFLGRQTRSLAFATAPLGSGLQRLLGQARLAAAPELVTHIFVAGDFVPEATFSGGAHSGTLGKPLLEPPPNWSGVLSERDKEALLLLSGLSSRASPYLAMGVGVTTMMAGAVDLVARHSMENYVAALVSRLGQGAGQLDMVGEWESKGSFFQISSNTARFVLTANGHLVLDDHAEITIPGLNTDGPVFELSETGDWCLEGSELRFQVGGVASMRYGLVGFEQDRVTQWRRDQLEPDLAGLVRSFKAKRSENPELAAHSTALVMKGAFALMRGKVVTWRKLRGF